MIGGHGTGDGLRRRTGARVKSEADKEQQEAYKQEHVERIRHEDEIWKKQSRFQTAMRRLLGRPRKKKHSDPSDESGSGSGSEADDSDHEHDHDVDSGTEVESEEVEEEEEEGSEGGAYVSEEKIGRIEPGFFGIPIEELDPFVPNSFCVLTRKFGQHYLYRFSEASSLNCFKPNNRLRRLFLSWYTHELFDWAVMFIIILNCVVLAFDNNELEYKSLNSGGPCNDPTRKSCYLEVKESSLLDATHPYLSKTLEWIFLFIFTLEAFVKVVSKGFYFMEYSYLKNHWNKLDFAIVIAGYVTEIFELAVKKDDLHDDLDVLRAMRVLRAVKLLSLFPGLRLMLNSITSAITQLIEVAALMLFCLSIFALFGLNLFSGKLHQVCVDPSGSYKYPNGTIINITCLMPAQSPECQRFILEEKQFLRRSFPASEPIPCGNRSSCRSCPANYTCRGFVGRNPDDQWTSFDNILLAILTTFQVVTLDYWERIYELLMSVVGPSCVPWFVMVIFFGAFYLMNLMLAVVTMSYEDEVSGEEAEERKPPSAHDKLAENRKSEKFTIEDPLHHFMIYRYDCFRKKTTITNTKLNWEFLEEISNEKDDTRERSLTEIEKMATFSDVVDTLTGNVRVPKLTANAIQLAQNRQLLQQEKLEKAEWRAEMNAIARRVEDGELLGTDVNVEGDVFEDSDDDTPAIYDDFDFPTGNLPDSMFIENSWADEILASNGKPYLADERKTRSVRHVSSLIERIRAELETIVNHWLFEAFITTAIILNTILLAADHHDAPKWFEHLSTHGSEVFTAIFTLECAIKIFALRREYFRQPWNLLDLFIVLTSLIDETLQETGSMHNFPATKAIRVLRLLRIFKLAQSWITMKILLNIIFSTFGSLANLTVVLLLMIYVFAVLGMQFIGRRYIPLNFGVNTEEDEDFPRWNFKDIWHSFMMIFRVLCGEWIEPLWECLKAHEAKEFPNGTERESNEQWKCFFIFLPSLVVGNFIVLNLFLALLLDSFSSEEITAQRQKEEELSGKQYDVKKVVDILANQKVVRQTVKDNEDVLTLLAEALNAKRAENEFTIKIDEKKEPAPRVFFKKAAQKVIMMQRVERAEEAIAYMEQNRWMKDAGSWIMSTRPEHQVPAGANRFEKNPLINVFAKKRQMTPGSGYELHMTSSTTSAVSVDENWEAKESEFADEKQITNPNCFPDCCTPESYQCCMLWKRLRKLSLRLVSWSVFEWGIIILILASSITLCFEDVNLQDGSELKKTLDQLNNVFTTIFVVEMLLKWMAYGFYQYFTTAWTVLDFIIVVISVITIPEFEAIIFASRGGNKIQGLAAFKALRTLRALRPLRAISRWEGMKIVVNALINSIPSIRNVLVVCLLFWLVFAIMAVNLFKGKFHRCVYIDDMKLVPYHLVPNKTVCCSSQFSGPNASRSTTWINNFPNFDNVFMAYLSLFQIATFEGWIELMKAASDLPSKVDEQPRRDQSYAYYFFFVVFIIFGSFFTLNLFIGVIIDNFNTLKKQYEGNFVDSLLTPGQRKYYTAVRKLGKQKPTKVAVRPNSILCALCYDIVTCSCFEPTIFAFILLNILAMSFEHYNMRLLHKGILNGINGYFGLLFGFEAIVKIAAFRLRYFKSVWNLLDFGLVILFFVDILSQKLPVPSGLFRLVRVFRIGRLFRIIKVAKGIKKLLFALVLSLPALFNIGALLALITFIYSIIGMALFKEAVYDDYRNPPYSGAPIDGFFSFQTFSKSSLMLFRLFTAAGWNEVLDSLVQVEGECGGSGGYHKLKCGGPYPVECIPLIAPILFMVSYLVITYLIIINMYIAVILENYEQASQDLEIGIFEEDIEAFYTTWGQFDPDATQFINFEDLSAFLAELSPPFCVPYPNMFVIIALDFPIVRGNKIHCLDILHILVKRILGKTEGGEEFRKVQVTLDRKFRKDFPARKMFEVVGSTKIWKLQQTAAVIIQTRWREHKKKQKEQEMIAGITQKMFGGQKPGFGFSGGGTGASATTSEPRPDLLQVPEIELRRRKSANPGPSDY